MTLAIGMYSFDCGDASRLPEFWSKVIGKPVDDGATADYATLDFDLEGPTWIFVKVPERATGSNRFMLDLTDPAYPSEAQRIEHLGAERVSDSEQDGVRWTVFRDPEGNTFRIFAPRPTA